MGGALIRAVQNLIRAVQNRRRSSGRLDGSGRLDSVERTDGVAEVRVGQDGRPVTVTRRGHPVAVLSAIDAEEFYDYVLAHAPEFVVGREAAEDRFARGAFGQPLDEVIAELDAEDQGTASV